MTVMSDVRLSSDFLHINVNNLHVLQRCESSEDDEKKLKRREKNRVAAQRSRKKQTQKADKLHEEYKFLEQSNVLLRKEVQMLLEEQRHLMESLKAHEPHCPIIHCSVNLMSRPRLDVAGCLPSCLPR